MEKVLFDSRTAPVVKGRGIENIAKKIAIPDEIMDFLIDLGTMILTSVIDTFHYKVVEITCEGCGEPANELRVYATIDVLKVFFIFKKSVEIRAFYHENGDKHTCYVRGKLV